MPWAVATLARAVDAHRPHVIVARSNVPIALARALAMRRVGLRVVFDADGLPHDERIEDSGDIDARYCISRFVEMAGVMRSSSTLVRSTQGRDILQHRVGPANDPKRLFVAPNGRDPSIFRIAHPSDRARLRERFGVDDGPLGVYVGSLGPKYMPDWIRAFVASFLRTHGGSRFVVATGHVEVARQAFGSLTDGPSPGLTIVTLPPHEVPDLLAAADVGLAFVRPSFSTRAVSPIKVGEYLLAGCPVLATAGVGDLDSWAPQSDGALELICDPRAAAMVERPTAGRARELIMQRARAAGLRWFSLDRTVAAYQQAIQAALMDPRGAADRDS